MADPVCVRDCARGSALIVVLLLLLALTALGHGVFLVAGQEASASRATAALVQARVLAEGAVRRVLRVALADTLPQSAGPVVLAQGTGSDASFEVGLRRLAPEVYWVEGRGNAALTPGGPQRVRQRVGRLLWSLSPVQRLRALSGAVEAGAGVDDPAGGITSAGLRDAGQLDSPFGCRDRGSRIDSVLANRAISATRSVYLVPGAIPGLGLVQEDSLLARIPARVSGTVSPQPQTELGTCVLAPSNWGSPSTPGGPCGGLRVAAASEQALTLAGGEGQGLLLVRGTLRLTAGARFHGLVLVGGDLVVEEGAVLEGLARVAGTVWIRGGAQISGRVCAALLALEAQTALRHPIQLPGSRWIPLF